MGPGAVVDGMVAARKLSASLGGASELKLPRAPQEAPQSAPGPAWMPPADSEPTVTIRVPMRALWALLKEVSIGE